MRMPVQVEPITRGRFVAQAPEAGGVEPQLICGICEFAISQVIGALVSGGCAEVDVGFEIACQAAGDWIPIIGEGPWEAACAAAGAGVGVLCAKYGTSWLASSAGVEAICSAMDFC